jgi:hypothetical protein
MATTTLPSGPGREWRCRIAPLVLCATVLVVVTIANVAGEPRIAPDLHGNGKYGPHFEVWQQDVEHGWPWTFLSHEGDYVPGTMETSPWRIGENASFSATAFLANLGIAAALAIATYMYVGRRMRLRGWQIAICELAVITVVAAMVLAFMVQRRDLYRAQVTFLQETKSYADWEPFGPHWLRRMCGDQYWAWGDRLIGVEIDYSDDLAALPGKGSVQVLNIERLNCSTSKVLKEFESLKALDVLLMVPENDPIESDEPDLRPCIEAIAQCKGLIGLNLYDAGISNRDVETISRLSKLENLCLAGNLYLDDRAIEHLASLKNLRVLELQGTSVTAVGRKRLQEALPNCEIHWSEAANP